MAGGKIESILIKTSKKLGAIEEEGGETHG